MGRDHEVGQAGEKLGLGGYHDGYLEESLVSLNLMGPCPVIDNAFTFPRFPRCVAIVGLYQNSPA